MYYEKATMRHLVLEHYLQKRQDVQISIEQFFDFFGES